MLLAIDRARGAVFLAVDLPALGWSQLAAVGGAVVVDFFVDVSFAAFQVGGFARGQLPAFHTLSNPFLLIAFPLSHFTLRVGILYPGVVLVFVDVLGKLVLLLIQGGAVGRGQVTVVEAGVVLVVCAATGSIRPAITAVKIKPLLCIFIWSPLARLIDCFARFLGHFFEHRTLENVARDWQ